MMRYRKSVWISTVTALVLIVVLLVEEKRSRAQESSLALNGTRTQVVTSTPEPPVANQPADTLTLTQAQPASRVIHHRVLERLQLGPPSGVADLIAEVNKRKKYRIGFSKFIQRTLAESIARRAPRNVEAPTLTESIDSSITTLTSDQVKKILDAKYDAITGTTPPADLQAHVKKQNAFANQVLKGIPRAQILRLSPVNEPTPSLTAFNWTQQGFTAKNSGIVTAVQDQSVPINCGCCWAFATVGAYEAAYAKANGKLIGASEQYLLSCASGVQGLEPPGQPWNCDGGWWAFDLLSVKKVQNPGLPRRSDLTFKGEPQTCPTDIDKPYQIVTWGYVSPDGKDAIPSVPDLKTALCTYGPLAVAVNGNSVWFGNQGDVINDFPNNPQSGVNHAVVLVGWDDSKQAWLFKNSWGEWGIQVNGAGIGFGYIAYGANNFGWGAAWVVAAP